MMMMMMMMMIMTTTIMTIAKDPMAVHKLSRPKTEEGEVMGMEKNV